MKLSLNIGQNIILFNIFLNSSKHVVLLTQIISLDVGLRVEFPQHHNTEEVMDQRGISLKQHFL